VHKCANPRFISSGTLDEKITRKVIIINLKNQFKKFFLKVKKITNF
jgi:hypothetical protein